MFQFIPVHEDNIFAVRVSGKLSHENYQEFLPELEGLFEGTDEKISLLIELDDFHGAELSAIKDDFKWGVKHANNFAKVAIVGDKQWQRWMTLISSPFMKAEVEYFNRADLQEAWDWLREKNLSNEELADLPIKAYEKIMVGVDFSPHSRYAAKRAVKISERFGSEVVFVNIVNEAALYDLYYEPAGLGLMMTEFSVAGMEGTHSLIQSMRDTAKVQMNSLTEELGIDKDHGLVLTGRTNATLISYAEAQNVDLIVMGTHGMRGIDALLGSSIRYVQSRARCEVLSVPLIA